MSTYDVIIVGGRVAGSAAAIMLAQAGARVLLLERSTFPSAPVSVPVIFANALAIFDRIGVRAAIEQSGATKMYTGGAQMDDIRLEVPVRPLHGIDYHLGLRRERLDSILIEHAAKQPTVTVRTGFTVEALVQERGQVVGVRGRAHGAPAGSVEELRAAVVVGADGTHSLVARTVQPKTYRVRPGQNCVYYAYYRNFTPRHQPMTYSYRGAGYAVLSFEADDGLTAISVGAQPGDWPTFKQDPTGEFERRWRAIPELAELGRDAERIGPVKGQGPRQSYYRQPFGPGWALVGDAGYLKDPSTGQGIFDALRAAELLCAAWQEWQRAGAQPQDWQRAMRRYQRTRDRETRMMYEMTFQSSKIPKQARLNLGERLLFGALARDTDFVAQLAGIYNGASSLDDYTGLRGGFRFMARLGLRPLALRWATGTLPLIGRRTPQIHAG